MTRNDLFSATIPALRIFLKEADAYRGHSRDGIKDLRAHALSVFDAAQPAVEEEPEPTPEPVVEEPKAEEPAGPKVRKLTARQVECNAYMQSIAGGTITKEQFLEGTGYKLGAKASAWTDGNGDTIQAANWNPYYSAALRLGLACLWSPEGLTTAQLDAEGAEAQRSANAELVSSYKAARKARGGKRPVRENTAARLKAREAMVSKAMVGKLAKAIEAAEADAEGRITLSGEALALSGVAASWARISTADLQDAAHVKARTFAALGFTAECSRGALILTPVTAEGSEEAVA